MKKIYVGKTLEDAIDKACDEFNVDPQYLYYDVAGEEKGLFGKKVEIEAYTITEVIEFAEQYLATIVKDYGLTGELTTTLEEGILKITLNTDHNSVLIGKNGRTLQALNNVLRSAVNCEFKHHFRLLLDISTYKEEKYEKIIKMARRIAHEVQKSKVTATLNPMTSDERRAVHNTLSHMRNIRTESTGTGRNRQINIIYVESKQGSRKEDEE